jgi:hypothetical protein
MPKTPINYDNAVIYKICCLDINILDTYVGSTTNFTKRKNHHKSNTTNINCKDYTLFKYEFIRQHGGWDNFTMIEIEKVIDCDDGNELRARERYYVETLKATLNKKIPGRTKKEYCKLYNEENKEKMKTYCDEHKEFKKNSDKLRYEQNKEQIKEKSKLNYEQNKEQINQQRRNKFRQLKNEI